MKQILLLLIVTITFKVAVEAQPAISPDLNGEFCPNTTITFTVTFAGNSPSVIAKALNVAPFVVRQAYNISTSNGVTTFNFDGRFTDANNKQTFQVNYKYGPNNRDTTKDFTFIKIKSLTSLGSGGPNDCSAIKPTPTSITAPRCQTGSVTINFSNISYSNVWENPVVCYGTVSNYEYLLPAGWQLGTSTSDGTTWLPGGNNVTITYDASTGDGSYVRIRPVNTACGANLNKGREVVIPISRPVPTLSISGADAVCSSSNYSVSGLPSGATVCWSVSDPNVASLPTSNCTNPISLSKVSDGVVTLTATVSHCTFTYTVSKVITAGTPKLVYYPYSNEEFNLQGQRFNYGLNGPGNSFSVCLSEYLTFTPYIPIGQSVPGITGHQWTISGTYSSVGSLTQDYLSVVAPSSHPNAFSFTYQYQNACGWSPLHYGQAGTMNCDGGEEPFRAHLTRNLPVETMKNDGSIAVFPNPTTSVINISVNANNIGKVTIRVYNALGKEVKKVNAVSQTTSINMATLAKGVYFIQVFNGQKTTIQKVVKN